MGDDQHERRSGTSFEKRKRKSKGTQWTIPPTYFSMVLNPGLEAHVVLEAVFLPLGSYLSCSSPSTSPPTSLPTSIATAMQTTTTITTTTTRTNALISKHFGHFSQS